MFISFARDREREKAYASSKTLKTPTLFPRLIHAIFMFVCALCFRNNREARAAFSLDYNATLPHAQLTLLLLAHVCMVLNELLPTTDRNLEFTKCEMFYSART